jgi:hypothetical protein
MPVHAAGIRKLPPISVPTPRGLPLNVMRADSPPEEPPDVSFLFNGFTVRPKTLFTDSAIIMAVGTFVLQYRTAPSFSSISTRVALYSAGLSTKDVNPTVLSLPLILKLSLREMGKPCSGPTSVPVRWRWSSSAFALLMASSKKASLRQLVYVWVSWLS